MEDAVFKAIAVLGFPIVSAIALAVAMHKVGIFLLTQHAKTLEDNLAEMRQQTKTLKAIEDALPSMCRADCLNFLPTARTLTKEEQQRLAAIMKRAEVEDGRHA